MRGGTNRAGVPAAAFAMPAGLAMRYDLPCDGLRELVSGYATYAAQSRAEMINWFLPAPPMICVLVDAGSVDITVRNHRSRADRVSLYGPTSCAFRAATHGGIQVGIGLTALGWIRLTASSAQGFHNRVLPLEQLLGDAPAAALRDMLDALDQEEAIAPALDAILTPLFAREHRYDDIVRRFTELMLVDGVIEIADAAERLVLPGDALRRVAAQAFGMAPKLLLRRARFLRSFISLLRSRRPMAYELIDSSYYDASHFLRDSHLFLGTTPRRFMAQGTSFLTASLVARSAAIGAPAHGLHASTPPARERRPGAMWQDLDGA
ncbi:hypothetical protein K7957_11380 [Sphingomonas yunnanensis]|uniref:hypothetical protein n=1 Tax=Sphingomonas yunnanensis TaxID=310400 RepID=UPI001CA78549|nr:hypothetical protein [Sphingomonas yunnanensis]MBY9063533.1 hypothetical protein [Sphingomonas yunnanensis]